MALIKNTIVGATLLALVAGSELPTGHGNPITTEEPAIDFTTTAGSGAGAASQEIMASGVPIDPLLFNLLARVTGKSGKPKAGAYELKPGTTPLRLVEQLVRGEFAQESLTIIEGWTFKQMRQAMAANKGLRHDTLGLSDKEVMALVTADFKYPEGLFFPDTYLFRHASDLQIYKQAHSMMLSHLAEAWDKRDPSLPYKIRTRR